MQTQTNQIVEQAISKQEAEEAGVIDDKKPNDGAANDGKDTKNDAAGKPKPGESDKSADNKPDGTPKYDKDGKRIEDAAAEKSELDKDGKPVEKPKEGKFTADDALEVEQPAAGGPAAPTDAAGIQLSPAEQKHIVDNIGEPVVIRGVRGEGENAKEVEIKAYGPNDIPADFKFANDQQRTAASTAFYGIEQKANKLLGEFRQHQTNAASEDFERRENEGIRGDVADLQKEGRFPKFTVQPGAAGFDDSPEAKQMAEVLGVMTERNATYLAQYNQGRPYKHIGFAEAFDIYERKKGTAAATAKKDDEQEEEDKDRRERGAEKGSSNRGMNPGNVVKPTVRPGTSTRDLLNRIDTLE